MPLSAKLSIMLEMGLFSFYTMGVEIVQKQ